MPAQIMPHSEHTTRWVQISEDEYDTMKRTIEVLSDQELVKQLIRSEEDIREGKVSKWKDFVKEWKGK